MNEWKLFTGNRLWYSAVLGIVVWMLLTFVDRISISRANSPNIDGDLWIIFMGFFIFLIFLWPLHIIHFIFMLFGIYPLAKLCETPFFVCITAVISSYFWLSIFSNISFSRRQQREKSKVKEQKEVEGGGKD